ncbi:hypothetical protein POPTR_006G183101v4, partial [Populus trichocarpa]
KCCPPTKPTSPHRPIIQYARNTLLQPPKKSHLHHCLMSQKNTYFSPNYVGFFGFSLSWSEFHRENRKARTFPFLSLSLISLHYPHPSRSHLSFYYFLPIP